MRCVQRIEVMAWTVGLALLFTYGGIRAWAAHASYAGVEALKQVRAELLLAQPSLPHRLTIDLPQPDTSTWSRKRLAAYREGIRRREVPEAVIRIPALKLTVPIYQGTSELNLNRGAGHIEGTAPIGEAGNMGVAGHRDGFFRTLKDAQVGQALYIDTADKTLSYRIVSTQLVDPADVSVLSVTSAPTITLVTCYPFYFVGAAPKRFIVRAQLWPQRLK